MSISRYIVFSIFSTVQVVGAAEAVLGGGERRKYGV